MTPFSISTNRVCIRLCRILDVRDTACTVCLPEGFSTGKWASDEYKALEYYQAVMNTGVPLKVPSQRQ